MATARRRGAPGRVLSKCTHWARRERSVTSSSLASALTKPIPGCLFKSATTQCSTLFHTASVHQPSIRHNG
jgi:hypothetical protein